MLGVSSSGYYNWQEYRKDKPVINEKDFLIQAEFDDYRGKYGSPRISKELKKKGYNISQATVGRRMKAMGLRVKKKLKYKKTTDSNHAYTIAPNLLNQNFWVRMPNQVWVSDITYIRTEDGWVYLVVILDLFSRKVISWQTSYSLEHKFLMVAFNLAILRRNPDPGVIFHSDRGVQYACDSFKETLNNNGFLQSMSARGNCYDNAVAEAFFKTLKYELIADYHFYNKRDLDRALFERIDRFYNHKRIHSTLDYQIPHHFEANYFNNLRDSICLFS